MAEAFPSSFRVIPPGSVIEVGDLNRLAIFEDLVAAAVKPDYDRDLWMARKSIGELIRPPKFHGTITGVTVEVMDDAYTQLLSAKERGIKKAGNVFLTETNTDTYASQYRGLKVTASARSTGRGEIGQIRAEAWYYPLMPHRTVNEARKKAYYKDRGAETGRAIGRIISRPILDTAMFQGLQKTSQQIAATVDESNMRHPFRGIRD
jgi:hypothetical protein